MKGKIANVITGCRIVLSLIMIVFPTFSFGFYACYLTAGITDMIDGTIARKLGTNSEFGEKFDTAADIVFVLAALYKLLPTINVGKIIWIWIGVIAVIKIVNIIFGFAKQKHFTAIHSWPNKIMGFLLFVLPFTMAFIDIKYSAIVMCLLASFAAIYEGYCIIRQTVGKQR